MSVRSEARQVRHLDEPADDEPREGRESGRSDLENYFFRDHGSGQGEMVQLPENGSYSILPLDSSEFYQEHNKYGNSLKHGSGGRSQNQQSSSYYTEAACSI